MLEQHGRADPLAGSRIFLQNFAPAPSAIS
jgi:hypothetical protein